MKKKRNKVLSFLMTLLMVLSLVPPSAFPARAAETEGGQVHVVVENTAYSKSEGAAWDGVLTDTSLTVTEGMTMMQAVAEALEGVQAAVVGVDTGYISSVNGLQEKAGGGGSGWMGTKNDWFVNLGFDKIKVEDGDEIRVMYSRNLGEDLGGTFSNQDTTIKDMQFGAGSLSAPFDSSLYTYELTLPDGTGEITVKPTAANKNYQVRIYKGENPDISAPGFRPSESIRVYNGETLTVICGDPSWPSMNESAGASRYTFKIVSDLALNTPPAPVKEKDSAQIELPEAYHINLQEAFTDAESDALTFTVSVNGAEAEAAAPNYTFLPEKAGYYELVFRASDGREESEAFTVSLVAGDGLDYTISASSTSEGHVEVQGTAKFNETVTVKVISDNLTNQYCVGTMEIKDTSGKKINWIGTDTTRFQTDEGPTEQTYTFVMPAGNVTLDVKFAEEIYFQLRAYQPTYVRKLELFDEDGNQIYVRQTNNSNPFRTFVGGGTYTYKFYTKTGELNRTGKVTADAKGPYEQIASFFTLVLQADSGSLPADKQHGFYPTVKRPDGSIVTDFLGEKVTTGSEPRDGYTKVAYLLDAKGEDYLYSYELQPADPNAGFQSSGANQPGPSGTISRGIDKATNFTYSFTLQVSDTPVTIQVSKDSGLKLYTHPNRAYTAWTEVAPLSIDTSGAEYDVYRYGVQEQFAYAVAGGGDTKYIKTLESYNAVKEMTAILDLEEKTDRREEPEAGNEGYMTDDLYTSIADDGNYITKKVEDGPFQLDTFRITQTVCGTTTNVFLEPDMHYEVIAGDSVTISDIQGSEGREYVNITPVKDGISVIKITYDSCIGELGNYFNPIDPRHTGIVIVNVGGDAGSIQPGISQTKYDTIYFTGTTAYADGTTKEGLGYTEYTFTPTADGPLTVKTHLPIHQEESFAEDTFTECLPNEDGSYTIRLVEGRNIVRLSSGDAVRYYTINALESDVTISNLTDPGKKVEVGDEVSVAFSGFTLPVQKMAAIYNPGFPDTTYLKYNLNGEPVEGPHVQYPIGGERSTITFTADQMGRYVLDHGKIHSAHLGSALDTHCDVPMEGMAPNFNAVPGTNSPEFCILPEVIIDVLPVAAVDVNLEGAGTASAEQVSVDSGNKTADWKLSAAGNEGYVFLGWALASKPEDIISSETEYTVTIGEDTAYLALFKKEGKEPKAAVTANPGEGGTVSAEKISADEEAETAVWRLTAKAKEGYFFTGWTASKDSQEILSSDTEYEVTLSADAAYVANFARYPAMNVTVSDEEMGEAAAELTGVKDGTSSWHLQARTKEGYTFIGWSDVTDMENIVSAEQEYEVTIDKDTTYMARFQKEGAMNVPVAAVVASPAEGGTVSAKKVSEAEGSAVWKLTAVPAKGYHFVKWVETANTASVQSTNAEFTITLEESRGFMAVFEKDQENPSEDKEVTLTYKNYPVSVTGKGLEAYELILKALTAEDEDVKLMQKQITSDKALIRLYEAKLYKDGEETEFGGTLALNINVGSQYEGKTLTVLHVVDGKVEQLTGTVKDGILTVSVTKLGKLGVVVDGTSQNPGTTSGTGLGTGGSGSTSTGAKGAKTGDETPIALYLTMAAAALGVVITLVYKKKKKA